MKQPYTTIWYPFHRCIKCRKILQWKEKMHSMGVCPECGHKTRGTICDTIKSSIRFIYKRKPWWIEYLFGWQQRLLIKTEVRESESVEE